MTDPVTRKWIRSPADEQALADGCTFDLAAAERVRKFFSSFLRHSKGGDAGKPFELLDWEWTSLIGPFFGWKKADGLRRYKRLSCWVSKKNGKSTICAGIILYGLVGDGEAAAHCYSGAKDRQQASIIFEEAANMVRQSPALAGRLKVVESTKRIVYEARASFYQVLSQEARKTGHGINASFVVIDELHVVNRELYSTLRYAGAARRQPAFWEISTAGNDKQSLGYERYLHAKQIDKGTVYEPDTLVYIAEAASNDVWEQPDQWRKANPSLGVTITLDSFKADFREAQNGSDAAKADFRQLRLNIWQDCFFAWLPVEEWDACAGDIQPEDLDGLPCWGGLDLSSKLDLCAFALCFKLPDGRFYILIWLWCPREADGRRQKENKTLLLPWINRGLIKATEGNVADYDVIEADVKELCGQYQVRDIAYDPWNAQQLVNHLAAEDIEVVEFGQTLHNYNEPTQEMEKLVRSRQIVHQGNKAMSYMISKTAVYKDPNGNIRPHKGKSSDRIDGVTAAIMALARAILDKDEEAEAPEITWI